MQRNEQSSMAEEEQRKKEGLRQNPERAIKAIDWLGKQLKKSAGFAYDFETSMTPWWAKNWKAYSVAFSWDGKNAFVVPLRYMPSLLLEHFKDVMRPIMADPNVPKTAHNQLFDSLCWFRLTGTQPYTTFDTMVAAHILDENRRKGLKWLGRALLGWPQWDIDATVEHPFAELAEYNGYDAAATLLLRQRLLADLQAQPRLLKYLQTVEMPKLRALERVIINGIYVDEETLDERIETCRNAQKAAASALPLEKPGSTQQVAKWLYQSLQLPVLRTTPAGAPSTDEETLQRLMQRHKLPELATLLEYRKQTKNLTTYLAPLKQRLEDSWDGREHPEYRSTSVETGRLASSFHTTPRESFIRSIYSAPAGLSLIQADYSQIEARIAAWIAAGKPATSTAAAAGSTMLSAWLTSRDVYRETAAEILSKPLDRITKDERQIYGKVVTLALLYNMTAKGLQEYLWREAQIDWTRAQAQRAYDGYYRRWPEFKLWHQREAKIIQARGYSVSPIGRMRRLPAAQQEDTGRQAYSQILEAINQGINQPVQSIASDLTQVSMIILDQRYGAHIVGNVHDALLFELPTAGLATSIPTIRRVMEQAPLTLRPLGLQLPDGLTRVEISVGQWGLGKEVSDEDCKLLSSTASAPAAHASLATA